MIRTTPQRRRSRRAAVILMTALLLVVIVGLIAFALDIGYIVLVRTQLQTAADASAMAAASVMGSGETAIRDLARQYGSAHMAAGNAVKLADTDVEFGIWDVATRTFTPTPTVGNAVRVTARRDASSTDGQADFFFAGIFGRDKFSLEASAVAMANPRDIAFVVDLSGSMNDDTEPQWATDAINSKFATGGYGNVGDTLMQDIYSDFGWGTYPGSSQYVGQALGVASDSYAYAELTKDNGPLAAPSIAATYRILSTDSESTRKKKAYKWMIDFQIASVMPNALPAPDSSVNYSYWEKYLDYIVLPKKIKAPTSAKKKKKSSKKKKKSSKKKKKSSTSKKTGGSTSKKSGPPPPPIGYRLPSGERVYGLVHGETSPFRVRRSHNIWAVELAATSSGRAESLALSQMLLGAAASKGTPPINRGWLPPSQDGDRIYKFNNPNKQTFPSVSSSVPKGFRNQIGYRTYAAFVLDHGRNLRPNGSQYTPISRNSPDCPLHPESTPGGTFSFPPRSQPMHAARRAIIAAIAHVESKNDRIPDQNQRDWVSIVAYDTLSSGGPVIERTLTGDYQSAMLAATTLQAVGDKGGSTATEAGLAKAHQHLQPSNKGGVGRFSANKVVVLLTDGVPNLYQASSASIDAYIAGNPNPDFYGGGYYWYDAALMQSHMMQNEDWSVYPVGIGLGTDYNFMDKMARTGGTASSSGQSPRGSGNPAEYEQRLTEIFKEIIDTPQVRIVE